MNQTRTHIKKKEEQKENEEPSTDFIYSTNKEVTQGIYSERDSYIRQGKQSNRKQRNVNSLQVKRKQMKTVCRYVWTSSKGGTVSPDTIKATYKVSIAYTHRTKIHIKRKLIFNRHHNKLKIKRLHIFRSKNKMNEIS